MIEYVEISGFDLRYEQCRVKNPGVERELIASIAEQGIRTPLEGVDTANGRILLNGFKRLRCARKLNIGMAPYLTLGNDEAMGIIKLLRISNDKSLTLLEQARLIDGLKNTHHMSISEMACNLEKSKSWVCMRIGLINSMSEVVVNRIFKGEFPVYSYMYTLRPFIRMNGTTTKEIDDFVELVAGKNLSIRAIEQIAYGYFKGPADFREQIKKGNINWSLEKLKGVSPHSDNCTERERSMLDVLDITQKNMNKVVSKVNDHRFSHDSFFAQANLLAGGILSKVEIFSKTLKEFYDRTGKTNGNLSSE